jgi:hypothetical protein
MSSDLTHEQRQEVRRGALLRAAAIVQQYQDQNWRRLRVNDVCSDIRRLLAEEVARLAPGAGESAAARAPVRKSPSNHFSSARNVRDPHR